MRKMVKTQSICRIYVSYKKKSKCWEEKRFFNWKCPLTEERLMFVDQMGMLKINLKRQGKKPHI